MNNQYDNLLEALADLNEKGFLESLRLTPEGLYCPKRNKIFQAGQMRIIEYHRFEGNTDLEDMAILYVLELPGEGTGVLIDAYGTYGDTNLGDFIKQIPFKKKQE